MTLADGPAITNGAHVENDRVENERKLKMLKDQLKNRAEKLLHQELPERILSLQEFMQSEELSIDTSKIREDLKIPPCKKVDLNQTLKRLFDKLKRIILQQREDCDLLYTWIELLIPKVEDGNNFGVDVQKVCLDEINAARGCASSYLDITSQHYIARGKMIVKMAKYPFVEDFRQLIGEIDESSYEGVKTVVRNLLNNYTVMHDVLTRNLEKIKTPRSTNGLDSMY